MLVKTGDNNMAEDKEIQEGKVLALLSYLGILCRNHPGAYGQLLEDPRSFGFGR